MARWMRCSSRTSCAPRRAGGEQAVGPQQQHRQQQRERQPIGEQRRDVARRELLGDAQHQSAEDRAGKGAEAADGDRDEAEIGEECRRCRIRAR